MKLCLVNLDFIPYRSSGLAVYGETLAQGLASAGHQVTVVAARHADLPAHERIGRIEVHRLPIGPTDWMGYAWRAGPLVESLQQAEHFDVVHFLDVHFAYRYQGPFVASLFQSFRQRATSDGGLPYHSNWRSLMLRLIYYSAARWLMETPAANRAGHLLAASQAAADEFMAHYGVQAERMTVVPLGIDLDRFNPQDAEGLRARLGLQERRLLLYVGFCTPRKGLDYLAQAMRFLPPDVQLLLVGRWETNYRSKFYRALGTASDRVVELGYVSDEELPNYYALADLFVFPTLLEGFGLPLVEAMACGTPVVTTSAGSSAEVAGPGGRIVPPRDPRALANAINELLKDPELRSHLSKAGRDWVHAHFGQEQMVQNTLEVYRHFVASSESTLG
ncbi:MAG: glycosyltransferase family 4 protein [Anaerolineae bacterium]